MISSNDLMVFYMGLELQSLALYVLATFNRDQLKSSEAGLKVFCFKCFIIRITFIWLFTNLWVFGINKF